ncbi:hypothetical protein H0H81_011468 [Sphagnurus paluster]|uniref:F-box domain-containing protein n=1 Tax=Sphagnurus paluster TaxID=117069 RepID=A0A9P7FUI7_9AGAR|nr:hypothetical protein H0H81_011468 [Sphagnurus paluster]
MLLKLPPELILRVLRHLDLIDLLRVSQVHSKLHETIQSFPVLQYRIATQSAFVQDNKYSDLPVPERLRILKNREEAWATCSIDFRRTIPVPHKASDIYGVTDGIYFLGDESHHILHYVKLPSSISDEVKWEKIKVSKRLIAIGLSIYKHDLIALITLSQPKQADKNILEIQLLKFSTGTPHPHACIPVLSVRELAENHLSVSIEIAGPYLALNVNCCSSTSPKARDYLYVFDWKTGDLKMSTPLALNTYSGLVILSEDTMILPNTNTSTLDVWRIPSTRTPGGKKLTPAPWPLLSLSMPHLAPARNLFDLTCRAAANPNVTCLELATEIYSRPPSPQPPFYQAAGSAPLMVTMRVYDQVQDIIVSWTMYARRADVLAVCERVLAEEEIKVDAEDLHSFGSGSSQECWILNEGPAAGWITTSAGTRCISFSPSSFQGNPLARRSWALHVLDFNPYTIRRATLRRAAARSSHARGGRQLDAVEHSSVVKALLEESLPRDSLYRKSRYYFMEPVRSGGMLQCISTAVVGVGSKDSSCEWRFDGVIMDEERLVGLKAHPWTGRTSEIVVMHIGTPAV